MGVALGAAKFASVGPAVASASARIAVALLLMSLLVSVILGLIAGEASSLATNEGKTVVELLPFDPVPLSSSSPFAVNSFVGSSVGVDDGLMSTDEVGNAVGSSVSGMPVG